MVLENLLGKKDFDDLKVGECIEIKGKIGKEEEAVMLACRTDKNTVKMKGAWDEEDEENVVMEMKKRPLKKSDF